MGFSVASTHLIFFIAVIAISAGILASFSHYVDLAKGGMSDRQSRLTDQLRTDIEIVNVYYDSAPSPDTVDIYVKNVGSKKLGNTTCLNVFLDNDYVTLTASDFTHPDDSSQVDVWNLQETIKIDARTTLSSDVHTVKIVTCNGITDSYLFST